MTDNKPPHLIKLISFDLDGTLADLGGFDRLVELMCGLSDIREVIAFPKNKAAECPMDGSPSTVPERTLKELGLKVDSTKK